MVCQIRNITIVHPDSLGMSNSLTTTSLPILDHLRKTLEGMSVRCYKPSPCHLVRLPNTPYSRGEELEIAESEACRHDFIYKVCARRKKNTASNKGGRSWE